MAEKIEDWGREIKGAKKHNFQQTFKKRMETAEFQEEFRALTEAEKDLFVNKSNIFMGIDADEMRARGVEASAVKYMKTVRNSLGSAPKIPKGDNSLKEDVYTLFIEFLHYVEDTMIEASRYSTNFRDIEKEIDDKLKEYLFIENENSISYTPKGKLLKKTGVLPKSSVFFDRIFNKHKEKVDFKGATWDDENNKKERREAVGKEETAKQKINRLEHIENVSRTGTVHRPDDVNATTSFIQETFGFGGGQFGNWVTDSKKDDVTERQKFLNLLCDALYDLAEVLNTNTRDLGVNGVLAVAFGARGSGGKAKAHYEVVERVMNLTRLKGSGSLAHEMFHFYDNYIGSSTIFQREDGVFDVKNNISAKFQTAMTKEESTPRGYEEGKKTPKAEAMMELKQAFSDLGRRLKYTNPKEMSNGDLETQIEIVAYYEDKAKKARKPSRKKYYAKMADEKREFLGETEFFRDGKLIDKSASSSELYWSTTIELGARAFESWVLDKIMEKGNVSDFLVSHSKSNVVISMGEGEDGMCGISPYPKGHERKALGEIFENVFKLTHSKENTLSISMLNQDTTPKEISIDSLKKETQKKVKKKQEIKKRELKQLSLF